MMVIICPAFGNAARVDDPDFDCEICAICGCIYGEIEDEQTELN